MNHSTQPLERSTLPEERAGSLDWESGRGRSYLIPAAEVLTYLFLLNQYDRHFTEPKDVYRTTGTPTTRAWNIATRQSAPSV